ncbi:MAG: endonuclease III [Thermoplasmata archaeon]|nr:MAG: endonuclease III [Thermoplasmata archaeon]
MAGKKQREKEKRTLKIIRLLEKEYTDARIALKFSNPLELLVAVMLSAQCTDIMVNQVTKDLFRKYKSPEDYARADEEELQDDIRKTGFFRQKAKNLKGAANMLVEDFGGQVPDSMGELLRLPGVARKTANIVLYNAFGIQDGIAVDTHVKRLSQRMGLSKNQDPKKIEQDLMVLVPRDIWGHFTYLLIDHGRAVCTGRKARCEECAVEGICPKVGVQKKKGKKKQ